MASNNSWIFSLVILCLFNPLGIIGAEEKPEARSLDDHAFKEFVNSPMAQSLGLLAYNANKDKDTVLIPAPPISKQRQIKLPTPPDSANFFAAYPYFPILPSPSAPISANKLPWSGHQNWPHYYNEHQQHYYNEHQQHYYNEPPVFHGYPKHQNVLTTLLQTISPLQEKDIYPSFIIVNPAQYGPYKEPPYGRPVGVSSYGQFARNTAGSTSATPDMQDIVAKTEKSSEAAKKTIESESSNDMEPIFMSAPALNTDEEATLTDSVARSGAPQNAMLESLLKGNQRRQLHEAIAAIYLRNYNANKK